MPPCLKRTTWRKRSDRSVGFFLVQLRSALHGRIRDLDLHIEAPDLDVGQKRAQKRVLLVAGVAKLTVEPQPQDSAVKILCCEEGLDRERLLQREAPTPVEIAPFAPLWHC